MRDKTSKKLQTLQNIYWTVIKQGRRGSEISSLSHAAFCPLFATLGSRYPLFLCAISLLPASGNTQIFPPVPWDVHRNILQCSRLVPETFCWQFNQPQPSLLKSSFLIFLCISLPGFCLFYIVPTVLPWPSLHTVMPPLWCELLRRCRPLNHWCQEEGCHERWEKDQSLISDWREEEIRKDILKDKERRSVASQALINRNCSIIWSKSPSSHNTLNHFMKS